jgi:metal-responsive CopG/Arc/MetJ family transcriptional regulator
MTNIRIAISIPETLFERVDAVAEKQQISQSRLFVLAIEEYLRQVENQELLQAINAAYDEPPSPEEKTQRESMRRKHRKRVEGQW